MTKTIKLPPLVIDEPTAQLIHRLAEGTNVSNLLREWIRSGIVGSSKFAIANTDNLVPAQICVINKHGRPRKTPADVITAVKIPAPLVPDGATPEEVEAVVAEQVAGDAAVE